MSLVTVFSQSDIFQIQQQGGYSFEIYNLHSEKIIYAITINNVRKEAFVQLAQNSKKNTNIIDEFIKNSKEEINPKLMLDTIWLAQKLNKINTKINLKNNDKIVICI